MALLQEIELMGIDEFDRYKGHRYDTILCDLDARQVLEISAGRTKDEVSHLLERLSDYDTVQLALPHSRIVADHFHVIQHVDNALKKVIGRHAKGEEGKKTLEGQSHLFLRNQENLSTEEERSRAAFALAFPEIAAAWQLKEALRTWYATTSAVTSAQDLDVWIASVSPGRDQRKCVKPNPPFATGGR